MAINEQSCRLLEKKKGYFCRSTCIAHFFRGAIVFRIVVVWRIQNIQRPLIFSSTCDTHAQKNNINDSAEKSMNIHSKTQQWTTTTHTNANQQVRQRRTNATIWWLHTGWIRKREQILIRKCWHQITKQKHQQIVIFHKKISAKNQMKRKKKNKKPSRIISRLLLRFILIRLYSLGVVSFNFNSTPTHFGSPKYKSQIECKPIRYSR